MGRGCAVANVRQQDSSRVGLRSGSPARQSPQNTPRTAPASTARTASTPTAQPTTQPTWRQHRLPSEQLRLRRVHHPGGGDTDQLAFQPPTVRAAAVSAPGLAARQVGLGSEELHEPDSSNAETDTGQNRPGGSVCCPWNGHGSGCCCSKPQKRGSSLHLASFSTGARLPGHGPWATPVVRNRLMHILHATVIRRGCNQARRRHPHTRAACAPQVLATAGRADLRSPPRRAEHLVREGLPLRS